MSILPNLKAMSTRELLRDLAEYERKHPQFINSEARVKDELRRRDQEKAKGRAAK